MLGITLSEPQAALARERAAAAGVEDLVEIRVMDYRELGGERFDAISSIGMVEHVGEERIDLYAVTLFGLLNPGGCLLNHGIAKLMDFDTPDEDRSRALRLPRRGAVAPVGSCWGWSERAVRDNPRRGLRRRLRANAERVDRALRAPLRAGCGTCRRGACASVAAVSACVPSGLHDRLGVDLQGTRAPALMGVAAVTRPLLEFRSDPGGGRRHAVGGQSRSPTSGGRPLLEQTISAQSAGTEIQRIVVVLGTHADALLAGVCFGRTESVRCPGRAVRARRRT